MLKEAIEKIIELGAPHIVESKMGGIEYSDKKLFPVKQNTQAEAIHTSTMSSIVEYVRAYAEKDGYERDMLMLHIVDFDTVHLINSLNSDSDREIIIKATAKVPQFEFGRFIDNEKFTIMLQSMFVPDKDSDRDLVLKFAGTVTNGSVTQYKDDGVTQKATIRQGVASKAEAVVPSPCLLRPFRTFLEIEQPMSRFVFRMKDNTGSVDCALFNADGGAWKLDAMNSIKEYFEKELAGAGVTIIM